MSGTSTTAIRFLLRLRARFPSAEQISAARLLHEPLAHVAALCALRLTRSTSEAWTETDDESTWAAMDACSVVPAGARGVPPWQREQESETSRGRETTEAGRRKPIQDTLPIDVSIIYSALLY